MSVLHAEILCALWREVGRHLDIEESIRGLFDILSIHLPVDFILVRRWDPDRSRLESVGWAGALPELATRSAAPTPRRDEFVFWAEKRTVYHYLSREQAGISRFLVPEGVSGALSVVPLWGKALEGVLVLGGALPGHHSLLLTLAEPLTVALENDRRLHELARLREAAESDRQALLSRLNRQDVSDAIVGEEAGLRPVMERVAQVAPTDVPVLILGETGSGKEVVARAVHARSRRGAGPFLRVNCGAIPTELVDSELFGHEKGSFTGAINLRKGWFERSDGGTLFLDEIGELPLAAQVRLLRVLQDGTFQRVGGHDTHSADVRVVAATHRDMGAMVRDGRFRQDLWYRISVFPIALPALRQRRGDIPALARHLSERAGMRLFGRAIPISNDDLDRLCAYDWPGNVRELAAVIERAAILGNGRCLDVSSALGGMPGAPATPDDRDTILKALRQTHGRIEGPFGAAKQLGVNPHTLRSRMRRLGIEWSQFREE
jgi:transcriptional regulator with GAF, ATPase, and Fis domain